MATFDDAAAAAAGYSPEEIAAYKATMNQPQATPAAPKGFDREGAKAAGYSDKEIEDYLRNQAVSKSSYDPTEGMSTTDKMLAGAGKAFVDTGRGIHQLYAKAADYVDPLPNTLSSEISGIKPSRSAEVQQDIDNSRHLDAPLMNTKAGLGGNVGGYLALNAPLAAAGLAPSGFIGGAALGAGEGALQPVATGESRGSNAEFGALTGTAGQALGKALSRLGQPIKASLTPESAAQVDLLRNAGLPLDVGQRTQNPTIQRLISSLGDNPFSMGAHAANREAQQLALNRAVLTNVGADADRATPEVLAPAKARIGGVYNTAAARGAPFDEQLGRDLQDVQDNASLNDKGTDLVGRVTSRLSKAMDNETGKIDGKEFQKTFSALGAQTKNPEVGEYARDMRTAMRGAIERSATPEDAQALRTASNQYQALKQIEPAVTSDGDISVKKLAQTLNNQRNRGQSLYGYGNQSLVDLSKAARTILPDELGNSGTTPRAAMLHAPTLIGEAAGSALKGHFGEAIGKLPQYFVAKGAAPLAYNTGKVGEYLVNGAPSYLKLPLTAAGSEGSRLALANALRTIGTNQVQKDLQKKQDDQ